MELLTTWCWLYKLPFLGRLDVVIEIHLSGKYRHQSPYRICHLTEEQTIGPQGHQEQRRNTLHSSDCKHTTEQEISMIVILSSITYSKERRFFITLYLHSVAYQTVFTQKNLGYYIKKCFLMFS